MLTVEFELDGQTFTALNGGPQFKFTEAVSFQIMCDSQDEIDRYWARLCDGGKENVCGWLKDRYGLSWQVVPSELPHMLTDADRREGRARADGGDENEKIRRGGAQARLCRALNNGNRSEGACHADQSVSGLRRQVRSRVQVL